MKNQMATVGSISKTNRQRRRITCAARPKPIALSAHSRRTLYPHHSGGSTPKGMTPRRDFTPHRFRLSATTSFSQNEQLRSPIVVAAFAPCYGYLPNTRLGSIAYPLKLPRLFRDFCRLPPATSGTSSNTNSQQVPGSISGVHTGLPRSNFAYRMTTQG